MCGLYTVMASAASPKRMVSSVFITLASPYRATVTQQQPALQAHSAPARDKQHTAVRISPSDSIPAVQHRKEDVLPSGSSLDSRDRTYAGPWSPKPAQPGSNSGKLQVDRGAAGFYLQNSIKTVHRTKLNSI